MTDMFDIAAKILDGGAPQLAERQMNFQLTELIEGIARVQAFSLSIIFKTEQGLVVIDTGLKAHGKPIVKAIRSWSEDPFHTLIYTHGHVDHVGGSGDFWDDAKSKNHSLRNIIGHENVLRRFERYRFTDGFNKVINLRQMSQAPNLDLAESGEALFLDKSVLFPNITYSNHFSIKIGELTFDLHHAKGETDDHTWVWIPERRVICPGDLFIWVFPNAGNPQKVQRYPLEWVQALREMAGMGAEYCLPSHGWPIKGKERIRNAFLEVADALDKLVNDTLEMMNSGATLNEIIHNVKVDKQTLSKGHLTPIYDEPEFIVNNIWRLYGGWYDGNPANLKPAKDTVLAAEIATLAGGPEALALRAEKVAESSELRLACHLIEMAYLADPKNRKVNSIRSEVYRRRRESETSLMARGIFGQAESQSKRIAESEKD